MKVLLITWACDAEDVSEPKVAYEWVREISKRHEVTLFAISRPDRFGCVKKQFPEIDVIEWKDINVYQKLERFRAIAKPGYFMKFWRMRSLIKNIVAEKKIDIIHHLNPFAWRYPSPAFGLNAPLVKGPVAGGLKTPKEFESYVEKGFHPFRFLRKTDSLRKKIDVLLIKSYAQTDCVIGAAPYVFDLLKPLEIRKKILEVELGFEKSSVPTVGFKEKQNKDIQLLFVGRIIKTKGLQFAIEALSLMKMREKVKFLVIGDGEELDSCIKLAKARKVENLITFKGWCSKDIVNKAYANSDIFLFPSFREPTGGVLLEAMLYGLPIITCDYGGPAYLVDSGSGIKIAPSRRDQFVIKIAEALDLLVTDGELRVRMGQNAYANALERFEWTNKMDRLDKLYKTLIN